MPSARQAMSPSRFRLGGKPFEDVGRGAVDVVAAVAARFEDLAERPAAAHLDDVIGRERFRRSARTCHREVGGAAGCLQVGDDVVERVRGRV